jgi:hypothetical protein
VEIDRTCVMRYCLSCNTDAVHPFEWEEAGPDHWDVLLRCGNCDTFRRDIFHQVEVEDFDAWLDDCMDEIQNAAVRMARDNFKEWGERFVSALSADAILPEDFGREA